MPHAIPSTVTNAKTTSAPSQKSGSDGGDSGPARQVTQASYGKPKPGFNGGKGF